MRFFQQTIVKPEELPMPLSWAYIVLLGSNAAILLEANMTKLKLSCFRKVMRSQRSLEKTTRLKKARQQAKRKTTHNIRSQRCESVYRSWDSVTGSPGVRAGSAACSTQLPHECVPGTSWLSPNEYSGCHSEARIALHSITVMGSSSHHRVNRGFRQEGISMLSVKFGRFTISLNSLHLGILLSSIISRCSLFLFHFSISHTMFCYF